MLRKIIHIDEAKCNGCGACAAACHEGAIAIIDGKARLIHDDYCDGLGDCLPHCPTTAITFIEREAAPYDEDAVAARMMEQGTASGHACPGSQARSLAAQPAPPDFPDRFPSQLRQWPVQIKLVSLSASYFDGADLLIAADCTAYAYARFHDDFMRNTITLIGCPKLDAVDYTEKLTAILQRHAVKSLTVARMEVPCCGALERAAKTALQQSKSSIPFQVYTITLDGHVKKD